MVDPPRTDLAGFVTSGGMVPRILEEEPERARDGWSNVGRDDRARAVDRLLPTAPFVTELTAAAIDVASHLPAVAGLLEQALDADATAALAAARDLAWSLRDVERAARLERARYLATGLDDLPLLSHDALTLALSFLDRAGAADLDLPLA
jgi:hypothetical protein